MRYNMSLAEIKKTLHGKLRYTDYFIFYQRFSLLVGATNNLDIQVLSCFESKERKVKEKGWLEWNPNDLFRDG